MSDSSWDRYWAHVQRCYAEAAKDQEANYQTLEDALWGVPSDCAGMDHVRYGLQRTVWPEDAEL